MTHDSPFYIPRVAEFGRLIAIRCPECEGTGTAGHGARCHHCTSCDGSGEVDVHEGEAITLQAAE